MELFLGSLILSSTLVRLLTHPMSSYFQILYFSVLEISFIHSNSLVNFFNFLTLLAFFSFVFFILLISYYIWVIHESASIVGLVYLFVSSLSSISLPSHTSGNFLFFTEQWKELKKLPNLYSTREDLAFHW